MKDESTDICDQIKIAIFKQKYCKARNAKHTSFVVSIIYLLIIVITICIIDVKINKMSENKRRVINELIFMLKYKIYALAMTYYLHANVKSRCQ